MVGEKEKMSNIILGISVRVFVNLMLILVLVQGFVSAYHFSYKLFTDIPYQPISTQEWSVTIEEGSDVFSVASMLEDYGIVDGKYLFVARAYLGQYNNRILAGTYSLGPAMSPDTICRKICGVQSEEAS